jgi:hypothetical protein
MNEYERRMLDLAQNQMNLREAIASEGRLSLIEYFGYSTTIGSPTDQIAVGDTRQAIIPIQSDSYFILYYISASQQEAGAADVEFADSFSLQITDTGAGKTIYSAPSTADLLVGSANADALGIPFLLTVPRIIRPNTNIKIDVNNYGVILDRIFLSFVGAKVYVL